VIKRWFGLVAAGAALLFALSAFGDVGIPPLKARVTDLTATLSASQVQSLESRLRDFERAKGSQIAVLILPSTQPETIEQYSIRVAESWKVGRVRVDDGAILIVAKDDRKLRIEVGRGLEGAIPDAIAKRIVSEVIAPHFKSGDFYGGISAGCDALARLIEGESLPPSQPRPGGPAIDFQTIVWLFVALVLGDAIFKRVLGRVAGAAVSGGIVGAIVWFAAGVLLFSILGGVIGFLITLFAGSASRRSGWTSGGWPGGGLGGGGFGGGGWSGGGGGGFSGGGGDFGGGGASGSW
jgi:uncharacterized protein